MVVYDLLLKRLTFCDSIIKDAEKKIQKLPKGNLKATLVHNKEGETYQYYLRENRKDPTGRYLGKEERELARQLAQREYCEKVLKVAKREKKLIETLSDRLKTDSVFEAYTRLKEGKKILVEPYVLPDHEFARIWQAKKYEAKGFGENDPEIYTKRGERVRSKSEQLIADRLYYSGIPYRYEYPFVLKNGKHVYTDFTILNVRTRTEYRLEHFGGMDEPSYRSNAFFKIADYGNNGLLMGKHIIYTFEDKANPLDSRYLDLLIRKFFL